MLRSSKQGLNVQIKFKVGVCKRGLPRLPLLAVSLADGVRLGDKLRVPLRKPPPQSFPLSRKPFSHLLHCLVHGPALQKGYFRKSLTAARTNPYTIPPIVPPITTASVPIFHPLSFLVYPSDRYNVTGNSLPVKGNATIFATIFEKSGRVVVAKCTKTPGFVMGTDDFRILYAVFRGQDSPQTKEIQGLRTRIFATI